MLHAKPSHETMMLLRPVRANLSEILLKIRQLSFEKMQLKMRNGDRFSVVTVCTSISEKDNWYWAQAFLKCIFSCDQAALRTPFSVRLSVCHTFLTMFQSSYHHERSYYHWQKCPCKRLRSEVNGQGHRGQKSSILTQIGRFRTVTPVWIYQWLRNDA